MRRRTFLFLCPLVLGACSGEEPSRPRCSECGMFIEADSRWTTRAGNAEYDSPKCALRAEGNSAALRFQEYYGGEDLPGSELVFVVESDVEGPMGKDLVPVSPEQAEHFIVDHGGRSLAFEAINVSLLESLH